MSDAKIDEAGLATRGYSSERMEIDRVGRLLIAEWERVEGGPVNVSYIATFADMARVMIADREGQVAALRARLPRHAVIDGLTTLAGAAHDHLNCGAAEAKEVRAALAWLDMIDDDQERP